MSPIRPQLKISRQIAAAPAVKLRRLSTPTLVPPVNTMSDAPRATRPSILVVEDHPSLRLSVVTWLQCRFPDCLVQNVGSGEEALEHARTPDPDIVLMDINLPGIDGIEATRRMKAEAPKTAVIMLTTHESPHHRLAAVKAGASGYVAKRDMEKQLEAAIEGLLQGRARP